jgi:MFS family permease
VARTFGKPSPSGASIAAEVGLSFTVLGVGLGIIRLAALASLPLAGLADRIGRRRIMLVCTTLGLAVSAAAALSPGYWWFVALFALSRPLLAGTNTVSGVIAAEETRSGDRAKAIALVTAGWGAGSGLIAVVRGVAGTALSWRGLFALLVIPLAAIPLLSRWLQEPQRFERARRASGPPAAGRILARPPAALRSRLWMITALIGMLGFVTGPANALLFVYSESVLDLPKLVTAAMVAGAGVLGLVGLVVGRWTSDHLGRRVTAGVTQSTIAAAAILTYSGTASAVIIGYLLAIFAASMFAPAIGALAAELFPTSVRSTVAGWMGVAGVVGAVSGLVLFGVLVTALETSWSPPPSSPCRCWRCARCTPACPRPWGWSWRSPPPTERSPVVEHEGGAEGHRHRCRDAPEDVGQQMRGLDHAGQGHQRHQERDREPDQQLEPRPAIDWPEDQHQAEDQRGRGRDMARRVMEDCRRRRPPGHQELQQLFGHQGGGRGQEARAAAFHRRRAIQATTAVAAIPPTVSARRAAARSVATRNCGSS